MKSCGECGGSGLAAVTSAGGTVRKLVRCPCCKGSGIAAVRR